LNSVGAELAHVDLHRHRRRLEEHLTPKPEEGADPLLLLWEEPDVRFHELVQADRGEDARVVGKIGAVQVIDLQELALVEHTEVSEQALHHLPLGQHPDCRVEGVVVALERVREATSTIALLEDERLVAVLRKQGSGRDAPEPAADDDGVVRVFARLGHRSTLTRCHAEVEADA
jgi:hypothetical protein